ncbi:hypothetical protein TorRG33x02_003780 [Trema orientale]|uniref:Uncharacterized protein n=1 Tax=Trema orientale TaxID=63057 RepID=A0A2P5G1Y4_TREOI|nr:hypothetical protein TorRG33x02_003780 [Trema orientale]
MRSSEALFNCESIEKSQQACVETTLILSRSILIKRTRNNLLSRGRTSLTLESRERTQWAAWAV